MATDVLTDVVAVLGLPVAERSGLSPVALAGMIEAGLPLRVLDRVAQAVDPDDGGTKFRIVPRATLARRRREPAERLTAEESGRTYRLARTWAAALDAWKDADAARGFLHRPHALLEGRRPIDVAIGSDLGARLVEEILGRMRYGSAA